MNALRVTTPEQVPPDQGTPDHGTPNQGTPNQNRHDQRTADQGTPAPHDGDVPPPTAETQDDGGRVPVDLVPAVKAASAHIKWTLFAILSAWCAYLLGLPALVLRFGWPVAVLMVPTVGVFMLSWLGYYRHELWHNYVAGVHNPTWFNLVSYLLFSDPAVYRIAHPRHHKFVHTTADIEFFCENYETDRKARKRQFIAELIFGNMAWELTCLHRLFREGMYTRWQSRLCFLKRVALWTVQLQVCKWWLPGSGWLFFYSYAGSVWAGSLVTRHNQWIEHLGICANGAPLAERNLLTRNVRSDTLLGRLFNFLNHDDATEHVFHHTEPQLNTRGFPGLTLPPGARTVTVPQYAGILVDHYRSL